MPDPIITTYRKVGVGYDVLDAIGGVWHVTHVSYADGIHYLDVVNRGATQHRRIFGSSGDEIAALDWRFDIVRGVLGRELGAELIMDWLPLRTEPNTPARRAVVIGHLRACHGISEHEAQQYLALTLAECLDAHARMHAAGTPLFVPHTHRRKS